MKGCFGVVFVGFCVVVAMGGLIELWDMHQWYGYPLAILGWIVLAALVLLGIVAKVQQSRKPKEGAAAK